MQESDRIPLELTVSTMLYKLGGFWRAHCQGNMVSKIVT